jgi:hypothetical protein
MNIRVLLAFAAIVSVVVLCAAPATATSIAVTNPLFQDPPGPIGWSGDPTPWDSVPDGASTNYPTGYGEVNGVFAGDNLVEYNPTSADFASAAGDNGVLASPKGIVNQIYGKGGVVASTQNLAYPAVMLAPGTQTRVGTLAAPTLGSQALYNASTMDNDCAVLTDPFYTTVTLAAHTTYRLTVAIGQGLTNSLGYYAGMGLIVADAGVVKNGVVTGYTGSIITSEYHGTGQDIPDPGTFYDYTIQFNSDDYIVAGKGAGVKAGDSIRFGINLGTGSYATDMRIETSPNDLTVPEPSTLVLLASGLVGLLAYAWRKRK